VYGDLLNQFAINKLSFEANSKPKLTREGVAEMRLGKWLVRMKLHSY